jgi:hypothetical protein
VPPSLRAGEKVLPHLRPVAGRGALSVARCFLLRLRPLICFSGPDLRSLSGRCPARARSGRRGNCRSRRGNQGDGTSRGGRRPSPPSHPPFSLRLFHPRRIQPRRLPRP